MRPASQLVKEDGVSHFKNKCWGSGKFTTHEALHFRASQGLLHSPVSDGGAVNGGEGSFTLTRFPVFQMLMSV